ncbi:TRAP transporter small permease [Acuticoccus sp.]|uniref:TRAP transporter small permease n=1 Tax=Acuticoccus sp. TaxID=1904378 RepID=UPI003B51CE82
MLQGTARALAILEDAALAAVLAAMFGLVTIEIATRGLLGVSNLYSEELSRILLIAMAYLGVAVATRERAHIRVDVVVALLPAKARPALDAIADACALIFCGFAVWLGIGLVEQTRFYGLTFTHSTLPFPVWVAQTSVPIAFAITGLHLAARLVVQLARLAGR